MKKKFNNFSSIVSFLLANISKVLSDFQEQLRLYYTNSLVKSIKIKSSNKKKLKMFFQN